ncbi:dynein heavy chain 2, axonemal [Trichonephila clavipes]|nr:dynein heavy chain 2, axonemal [Trichonephila clavipes]
MDSISLNQDSLVRRYSLAEFDEIDFSTSDDFAIVVENLKNVITLEENIEESWTEEHEQIIWQFVIDPDSCILTSYFLEGSFVVECCIPKVRVHELFYIIKISPEKLVSSDYGSKLVYGTAKAPFFESNPRQDVQHAVLSCVERCLQGFEDRAQPVALSSEKSNVGCSDYR